MDNASVLHCTRIVKKNVNFNVIEVIDLSRSSEVKSDLPPDLKMSLMVGTNAGKKCHALVIICTVVTIIRCTICGTAPLRYE